MKPKKLAAAAARKSRSIISMESPSITQQVSSVRLYFGSRLIEFLSGKRPPTEAAYENKVTTTTTPQATIAPAAAAAR
jgi:hypothetical protein